MSRTIIIEGVIGSGKTSLLDCVEEFLIGKGYTVKKIPEPVEGWSDILPYFYSDLSKWAYPLQVKVYIERVKAMLDAYQDTGVDFYLLERSPFSDTLFVELLFKDGHLEEILHKHYYEWWGLWARLLPKPFTHPDLFIYADVEIPVSLERIKKRSRNGECKITADYQ